MADSEENYSQELESERVNHFLNKPAQGNYHWAIASPTSEWDKLWQNQFSSL